MWCWFDGWLHTSSLFVCLFVYSIFILDISFNTKYWSPKRSRLKHYCILHYFKCTKVYTRYIYSTVRYIYMTIVSTQPLVMLITRTCHQFKMTIVMKRHLSIVMEHLSLEGVHQNLLISNFFPAEQLNEIGPWLICTIWLTGWIGPLHNVLFMNSWTQGTVKAIWLDGTWSHKGAVKTGCLFDQQVWTLTASCD